MVNKKTKEDIEDEIKSVSRKRDLAIIKAQELQDSLIKLAEELYELRPDFVKVECIRCGGLGYLQDENKKKHICDICQGKEYTWMKLYGKDKK